MIYCDTNYLVRAYLDEPGSEFVRQLFGQHDVAAAILIKAEVPAALHRSFREGRNCFEVFQETLASFQDDLRHGIITTLTLEETVLAKMADHYLRLPANCYLRAADALHLACAAEHGFKEVYSNDRHFLAAARFFGLQGKNVIPSS